MSISFAEPLIAEQRAYTASLDDAIILMHADAAAIIAFWEQSLSWSDDDVTVGTLDDLEEGYEVLQPIPYKITREADGTFVASFSEANIAISGVSRQDAYQSLVAEILDTYDTLDEEPNLSPAAAEQFDLLRTYVVKT